MGVADFPFLLEGTVCFSGKHDFLDPHYAFLHNFGHQRGRVANPPPTPNKIRIFIDKCMYNLFIGSHFAWKLLPAAV